mgnify:CR=1 FL=1
MGLLTLCLMAVLCMSASLAPYLSDYKFTEYLCKLLCYIIFYVHYVVLLNYS